MSVYSKYKDLGKEGGILYAWFFAMHTRNDILLYGRTEKELLSVVQEIKEELIKLESKANFYSTFNELHTLNSSASISPMVVSPELYHIIKECLSYHKMTLGYFDISVKSDNHDGSTLLDVELDEKKNSICFHRKGIRLDLSGYLKGYGLEKIRILLNKYNLENALINLGNSSVMALGNHPHGEGWKISHTAITNSAVDKNIHLKNQCLTTSGNEIANREHIINPITGDYEIGKKYISVITDKGTDGEVLSTSLFIADDKTKEEIMAQFPNSTLIPEIN